MKMLRLFSLVLMSALAFHLSAGLAKAAPKKLVIIAGKPSHPPRMHEFNAGVQLLVKCLKEVPDLNVEFVLNGWPQDEAVFDGADAVVFYMDGGGRHEAVQENGRRLKLIDEWTKRGVGIGCMHYGVEVNADQAGVSFVPLIGRLLREQLVQSDLGTEFRSSPDHLITQSLPQPTIKDEWYFNMRFVENIPVTPLSSPKRDLVPILVAARATTSATDRGCRSEGSVPASFRRWRRAGQRR